MLDRNDVREGDKLSWQGASSMMSGVAVWENGDLLVYTFSGKSFRFEDLASSPSLEITGRVKGG